MQHSVIRPSFFQNYKHQAMMALSLFVRLVGHSDLAEETNISPLLVNLWNLTQKHSVVDPKLIVRLLL